MKFELSIEKQMLIIHWMQYHYNWKWEQAYVEYQKYSHEYTLLYFQHKGRRKKTKT